MYGILLYMQSTPRVRRDTLAGEVRAEMARQNIARGELSDKTGIPVDRLRRRLSGAQPFAIEELDAVSSVLGMELAHLIELGRAA